MAVMSPSCPPTPPSRAIRDGEERFKTITSPCEDVEDYRPGSYHPVVLGDVFSHQYKVIRKLGYGSRSTVWLAHDLNNSRYVALKILKSEIEESPTKLQISRHISGVAPEKGSRFITQLLDEFEHRGPNGLHKCLVLEPMGPNVCAMVEELPQFKPRNFGMKLRYPLQMAKSILKQYLQALAFLHENGIAHGNLHLANIMFPLNNINSTPEALLRQAKDVPADSPMQPDSVSPPVQRLDGKQDKWAPEYLCVPQPLAPFTNYAEGFKLKLGNMSQAYFFNNPPTKSTTVLGFRAPEAILNGGVNHTADIWTFGCLIFELITGQPLFSLPYCGTDPGANDDHLLSLAENIGPLPDEIFKHWTNSSLYFTPERKLFNCSVERARLGKEPLMVEQKSMEEWFDGAGPDLDKEEASKVKALIRRVLQYDPAKRPSAAELLSDPWFCKIDV